MMGTGDKSEDIRKLASFVERRSRDDAKRFLSLQYESGRERVLWSYKLTLLHAKG